MNVSRYRGIGQFGPAYEVMLRNDTHAPGSVDRLLLEEMVRLSPETLDFLYREFTPLEVGYQPASLPELEEYAAQATAGLSDVEERVNGLWKLPTRVPRGNMSKERARSGKFAEGHEGRPGG